jgi:hypothetical protein
LTCSFSLFSFSFQSPLFLIRSDLGSNPGFGFYFILLFLSLLCSFLDAFFLLQFFFDILRLLGVLSTDFL